MRDAVRRDTALTGVRAIAEIDGSCLVRRIDEQGQVFVPPYRNYLPAVLIKPISLMGSE